MHFFFNLMKVVQDQALSLNKDRQIVSVKRERFVEMGLNGKYIKKFGSNLNLKNEVYRKC